MRYLKSPLFFPPPPPLPLHPSIFLLSLIFPTSTLLSIPFLSPLSLNLHSFPHKDEPGFYLRQVSEPSLTDPSVNVMLCQYLTLFENGSILVMEVTYMDGENCVSTSADPLWMQTVQAIPVNGYPVSDHLASYPGS